jgi:DNA-binding Lrp family transcriptional regulator
VHRLAALSNSLNSCFSAMAAEEAELVGLCFAPESTRRSRWRCSMRAYVLINVTPGKIREVVAAVAQLEGVRHVDPCWGMPDVFVEVYAADPKGLNELVIGRIQRLDGVERTETHIAFD